MFRKYINSIWQPMLFFQPTILVPWTSSVILDHELKTSVLLLLNHPPFWTHFKTVMVSSSFERSLNRIFLLLKNVIPQEFEIRFLAPPAATNCVSRWSQVVTLEEGATSSPAKSGRGKKNTAPGSTNITGWKMDPDAVDVFPIEHGNFPAMLVYQRVTPRRCVWICCCLSWDVFFCSWKWWKYCPGNLKIHEFFNWMIPNHYMRHGETSIKNWLFRVPGLNVAYITFSLWFKVWYIYSMII